MTELREHWSSKVGFIFAAIGSAIGLGVLWKLPYTIGQNGGGFFLIAFMLCIVLIGLPVFIAELLIGRSTQKAAVLSFQVLSPSSRFWKLGGWLGVASSFLIMSFYSVIAGYGMSYILMSLTDFTQGLSAEEVALVYDKLVTSPDISILWHFIFTLVTMAIVYSGVRKGIEFWSKIMTKALLVFLIGLVIYSTSLPGFNQALSFIFYPRVEGFKFSSVLEALGLAFFTLSLGQGIMISYGSYMKKQEDIPAMACIVSSSVIVVALLSALVVFPVVFSYGFSPQSGTGLIFQTIPFLFSKLPGSIVLSTLFFVLFVFTAITSAVAFIEVCSANLMELVHIDRKKAVLISGGGTFLFGIFSAVAQTQYLFGDWKAIYGMNFLDNIDALVSNWLIPVGGLITVIFAGWVLDHQRVQEEFSQGSKFKPLFKLWHFSMRWIAPLLIFMILCQKTGLINMDALGH